MDIEQIFAALVFAARAPDDIEMAWMDLCQYAPNRAHKNSIRYDKNDVPSRRKEAFGENVVRFA